MKKLISVFTLIPIFAAVMNCSTGPVKQPAEVISEEPDPVPVGPQRPGLENPHNYLETVVARSLINIQPKSDTFHYTEAIVWMYVLEYADKTGDDNLKEQLTASGRIRVTTDFHGRPGSGLMICIC